MIHFMMEKFKKNILVPVDFSDLTDTCIEQAVNMSRFIDAHITLLYVVENQGFLSNLFSSPEITVKATNEVTQKLQKLSAMYTKSSKINISHRVEFGKVYEKILDVAKDLGSRFIIMGRNEGNNNVMGSNANHTVISANCPVITVTCPILKPGFKTIVLPLDLTKSTKLQLYNAISFGLHYNATIKLVSVLMGGVDVVKSRIYEKMESIKASLKENGIKCTTEIYKKTTKPVYKVVTDYAEDVHADLIMLMTHAENTNDNYIGAVMTITNAASDDENMVQDIVDPLNILKTKRK